MANRVFYRPNYGLDKKYGTDGKVEIDKQRIYIDDTTSSEPITPLEQVANDIVGIQDVIINLPEDIKPGVQVMIDLIKFIFVQIDPDVLPEENTIPSDPFPSNPNNPTIDPNEEADLIISQPDKIEPSDDDEYDYLVNSNVPVADIIKVEKDDVKLLDKYYSGSYLNITKDFLNKLKKAINDYYMDMAQVIKNSDDKTFDVTKEQYTYKTTDLKDKDLQHVSDYIIKSQIVRDQKTRMFNKLFCEREALTKVKACECARELYIRYLRENKRTNNDYIDILSNMTLEQSKLIYEKKLDENLYELYKYLNSSVIILSECLELYTKEAKSKLLLINEEGIVL